MSYVVKVDTREGDSFPGFYPTVPTRNQVIESIRGSEAGASMIIRLVAIVKSVANWPNQILVRRVEIVRKGTVIIGKIIFDRSR